MFVKKYQRGSSIMNVFEKDDQYLFCLEENGQSVYYNNKNGKLAICREVNKNRLEDIVENLEIAEFFSLDESLFRIDPVEIKYEQLYLAVSESCNFRCRYCRQRKTKDIINMTNEDIINAVDTFYDISDSPKSVVFFGGEPLLNAVGIMFAVNYIRSFDSDIPFSMVTNGALCSKELAYFFAANRVEVIVSLDGPEELNDAARISADGTGTYQNTLNGYRYLREAGCTVGISSVIGPHNGNYFEELVQWVIKIRPNSVGFCLPHGDDKNFAMQIESFDDVHRKMIAAFEELHENKIYLVQVEQKLSAFLQGRLIPYECKSCGKRIVACRNKKFGHCEGAITKPEMFFESIEQLTPLVLEYKKTSPLFIQQCRSCISLQICGGSCPYDKFTRFHRTDVPDDCRCGLNRLIAERSMRYVLENSSLLSEEKCHILSRQDRKILLDTLVF
jgi:sulfatase maturation enzyme AslB (radical SAM superfamily)